MFDRLLTEQDAHVLAALNDVSDEPIEEVALVAGVTIEQLRASMFRLALRQPDPEA